MVELFSCSLFSVDEYGGDPLYIALSPYQKDNTRVYERGVRPQLLTDRSRYYKAIRIRAIFTRLLKMRTTTLNLRMWWYSSHTFIIGLIRSMNETSVRRT